MVKFYIYKGLKVIFLMVKYRPAFLLTRHNST